VVVVGGRVGGEEGGERESCRGSEEREMAGSSGVSGVSRPFSEF
jgi:hypothetical protein